MKPPSADLGSDPLRRGRTDRRREAHEHPARPAAYQSGSEAIAQEVELLVDSCTQWLLDVTANNPRLLRMQLQPALTKALAKTSLQETSVRLTPTVHYPVVGVASAQSETMIEKS